jgi:hypothetical protein
MNPEIVFYSMHKKALAWDFCQIEVGKHNGCWDYGIRCDGHAWLLGRLPSVGKWKSRKECVECAVKEFYRLMKKNKDEPVSKNYIFYMKEFEKWLEAREKPSQLSLF